ncbi:MAG: hypothetical protein AAF318_17160 [Pseudomonadota bacterium]
MPQVGARRVRAPAPANAPPLAAGLLSLCLQVARSFAMLAVGAGLSALTLGALPGLNAAPALEVAKLSATFAIILILPVLIRGKGRSRFIETFGATLLAVVAVRFAILSAAEFFSPHATPALNLPTSALAMIIAGIAGLGSAALFASAFQKRPARPRVEPTLRR